MIWSEFLLIVHHLDTHLCLLYIRVRIKIRNGDPEFAVTNDSWPAFCYPHARQCSSQDIEKGLFRGELLVKVNHCWRF